MLKYRHTIKESGECDPVIQTISGNRLTIGGLSEVFKRLSQKTGFHISPHMLRCSFALLSYRGGADILSIQAQMGHSQVETTKDYIQNLTGDDILESHSQHSPADNLKRLK